MNYHIYGIGNALVDKEFEVDDQFFTDAGIEKGMMTLIDADQLASRLETLQSRYGLKTRACGGSAANTIIGASYFGANVFYTCNVADDEAGEFYVDDIRAAGVATNMGSERDTGITGKCLVMVTPDAERTMNTYLGITGELSEDQVDETALSKSEYVYIEGYLVTSDCCRTAAVRVRDLARKHGVKVAMTFSDPAMVEYFKDGVNEVLGQDGVDLLFCNEQEACIYAGTEDLEHAKPCTKSPLTASPPSTVMALVTCLPEPLCTPLPMDMISPPPAASPAPLRHRLSASSGRA